MQLIYRRYINKLQIGLQIGYKSGIPRLSIDGKQVVQIEFKKELVKQRSNDFSEAGLRFFLAKGNHRNISYMNPSFK
jgi:hypothetical protein